MQAEGCYTEKKTVAGGCVMAEREKLQRAKGYITEIRVGMRGEYPCVVYDQNAQMFLVENLNEIMNH